MLQCTDAPFRRRNARVSGRAPDRKESPVSANDTVSAVDTATAIDEQTLAVGLRIRALRRARGLTLVALAAEAGLSHSFLSQLERGRARPSMTSLQRVAFALGSSQVELLAGQDEPVADDDRQPAVLVRAGEGRQGAYWTSAGRMLATGMRGFRPMEVSGTDPEPGPFHRHAEDEFVYVLAGAVRIDLGDDRYDLGVGDALSHVGGTPHRWCAVDADGYRLLVVKERPETS